MQAELEAQTRDGERREAEASSGGHVAGFLNLPLPSSLGGPPRPPRADAAAQGKAAVADAKQDVGHGEGPAWPVLGFLGGIGRGRAGSSQEEKAAAAVKRATEEQKQGGFSFRGLFGAGARADAEKAKAAAAAARAAEERDTGAFSWEALKNAFSSEEKAAAEEVRGSAPQGGKRKGWKGLRLPFLGRSAKEAQTQAAEDDADEDRGLVLGFLKQNLLGQSGEEAAQEAAAAQGEEKPEGGLLGLFQKVKRTPDSTQSAAEAAEEKAEEEEAKGLLSKVLNLGQ